MSTLAVVAAAPPVEALRRAHRRRMLAGFILAAAVLGSLAVYGADYYLLDPLERPFSPKHSLLKPSGSIGIKLGFTALAMFLAIALYPLRKRWPWLARRGSSRHWLDAHVLLGATAPLLVAFHASFKFRGLAGMAFWIMLAVAMSGVMGRYLYAQIPRRLTAAELSLKEIRELQARTSAELTRDAAGAADMAALLAMPSAERIADQSMAAALGTMIALDLVREWRIAGLRRRALPLRRRLLTLGGFLSTRQAAVEDAVATARRRARLAKQVAFLARAQEVFRLWHVVHRPFSYSFAVLALAHVAVVLSMGFF